MHEEIHEVIDQVVDCFGGGDAARELLFRTGLAESGYRAVEQYAGGPALGFWQCEPSTHDDHWENYLAYRPELADKVMDLCGIMRNLRRDHLYAATICRIHYLRISEPLPEAGDVEGQAQYWITHYNRGGKGSIEHFLEAVRHAEAS